MRRFRPYSAQLLSVGGSALLTFLTAFLFSAEARGEFAIYMLISTLGGYLVGLGMPAQLLQAAAKGETRDARRLLALQVPIVLALSSAAFVVLWATRAFAFMPANVLVAACATAAIASVFNSYSWIEYGKERFAFSTSLRGAIPLIALVAALASYLAGTDSIFPTAVTYLLAQTAALILLLVRNPELLSAGGGEISLPLSSRLLLSLKYFGTQSLTMTLARLPTIAAGLWYGPRAVAVISIALSISELQSSLPQMRSAITFSDAAKQAEPRLGKAYFAPALKLLLVGTLIVIVVGLAASAILGGDYSHMWVFVLLVSPGVAAMALAASGINVLAVRHQYLWSGALLGAACVLAWAGLWMTKNEEYLGIATWSLISLLAGATICWLASQMPQTNQQIDQRPDGRNRARG